ncbi:MAG: GlcNAc-transferase family protein [Pseudomonadota bacterium]
MQQQDQIFVQIASYRDAELPKTIRSALSNAAEPNRLTFGICWQYDKATYTDLDPYIEDSRFRIDQVYYEDGNGCCWARNRTNYSTAGKNTHCR